MFVVIVGCGRVGSTVAKKMLAEGHEVSVLDEDPEAINQLERGENQTWEELGGSFTVGTALEIDALMEAGIDRADAFVASTDGDNTNLVIAQVAQRRFNVATSWCACSTPRVPPGTPSRGCAPSARRRSPSTCSRARFAKGP